MKIKLQKEFNAEQDSRNETHHFEKKEFETNMESKEKEIFTLHEDIQKD